MVDGRVVKRPHDGHRFFQPELWNCWWNLVNWRSNEPLVGKWRTVNWEGRGVWCGKSAPPRLQPPSMAVKDRWVGPASKYSTYWSHASVMGPTSLVVSCQQKLDSPPPHCFIAYYGREARYGTADRSAVMLWIGTGALLLGQWIYSNLLTTTRKVVIRELREICIV
jgi:hypothetical protein